MKNSFETASLERIDLEKAYQKAKGVLSERVKESDFVDLYGLEEIERDVEEIDRLKKKFGLEREKEQEEMKKIADIFEAIVIEQGELSQWFGEEGFTVGASEHDDICNGIDAVVEFQSSELKQNSHLALGMDVTFTSDTTDKFDRIIGQIERGKLAEVKYFISNQSDFKGRLENIPEVIIGIDVNTLRSLSELWLEKDQRALETHKVQIMILEEMKAQLIAFAKYAESLGKSDLASIYRDRLEIVKKIIAGKGDLYKKANHDLEEDTVYTAIMSFLRRWQKSLQEEKVTEN